QYAVFPTQARNRGIAERNLTSELLTQGKTSYPDALRGTQALGGSNRQRLRDIVSGDAQRRQVVFAVDIDQLGREFLLVLGALVADGLNSLGLRAVGVQ